MRDILVKISGYPWISCVAYALLAGRDQISCSESQQSIEYCGHPGAADQANVDRLQTTGTTKGDVKFLPILVEFIVLHSFPSLDAGDVVLDYVMCIIVH